MALGDRLLLGKVEPLEVVSIERILRRLLVSCLHLVDESLPCVLSINMLPPSPREFTAAQGFQFLWLTTVMLSCGPLLAEPPTRLRVIDNSGENLQQVGLGFSMPDTLADLAVHRDAIGPSGPEVIQILTGGPANLAGIQVGDRVIRLNLKRVHTAKELQEIRKDLEVGKVIKIAVRRQNPEIGEWATATLTSRRFID
jgi:membrane-associated protease RseP (regulator of RpoE activity)